MATDLAAPAGARSRARSIAPVWELAAIGAILLLAAVVRLGWPGLTEFKGDEARLYSLALALRDGQFALRGISSSVGFPNFPMSVWLYSLPLLVWPHPYAATLFTGLLNTLAVGGCYWLARRYWGAPAALAAALMFAVSPWAILYSRKIWAQNLLPLFVVGWGIAAALAFVEKRRAAVVLHLLCLAVAVQLHLAAVSLVPATLVLLVVFRRVVSWRWLLAGAGLALLTALPFLYYLGAHAGTLALPEGGVGAGFSLHSLRYALMINTGSDIHSLAGPEAFREFLALAPGNTIARLAWGALIVGAAIWMVAYCARRWEERRAQVGFIWLLWLAFPVLFFVWHSTPVYPHYLIATFPAAYLIAGAALGEYLERAPRRQRLAGWLAFGLTAGLQLYAFAALLAFVGSRATPGGFGAPLGMKLEAADRAAALVESGQAAEVIIAGMGDRPEVDEFPAEYEALLMAVPHRFADQGGTALFPVAPAAILVDGSAAISDTAVGDLYRRAAGSIETVPLRVGEGELLVMALPGDAAPMPRTPAEGEPLLANWVRLLGTDGLTPAGEGEGLWQVHWRTADNPDSVDYHFFNHLLDANGTRVAQVDGPAFRPDQWRAGDTVISRFFVPLPAGALRPLSMRVGMYRYPDLTPVPLLDAAANPHADALVVPLPLD